MQFYSQEQYDEYQRDLQGDGFTNDYQRAYFISSSKHQPRDERPRAKELTLAGKVVVMASSEVCCPITDGLIGYDEAILAVFDTQAEALAHRAFTEDWYGVYIYELPRQLPEPVNLDPTDDLPF